MTATGRARPYADERPKQLIRTAIVELVCVRERLGRDHPDYRVLIDAPERLLAAERRLVEIARPA